MFAFRTWQQDAEQEEVEVEAGALECLASRSSE